MSLIADPKEKDSWLHQFVSYILKAGPIPKHVAFIMDGNRRFARTNSLKTIDGHSQGFQKLAEVLKWCNSLNIKQVTVYAFSLENFKRSDQEVNDLMDLASNKLNNVLKEKQRLMDQGVCIRFIGDKKRLPQDLQQTVQELESATKDNKICFLNVCIAYTSRYEMVEGIKCLINGVENEQIFIEDIDEMLFEKVLQVPKVDLLIRTSGEIRLSDFLLWQCSSSVLSFIKSYWPDFSVWQFYLIILEYQRAVKNKENIKKIDQYNVKEIDDFNSCQKNQNEHQTSLKNQRINRFLSFIRS